MWLEVGSKNSDTPRRLAVLTREVKASVDRFPSSTSSLIALYIHIQAVQLMHDSRVCDSNQQVSNLIVNSTVHGRPVLLVTALAAIRVVCDHAA